MKNNLRLSTLFLSAVLAAALPSCTGPKIKGLPKNLPAIHLYGSKETPPHSMAKNEYPFDENGDYKTAWVSGNSRSESDFSSWRNSHGGEPTPHRDYTPPRKKSSSSSKSKSKSKSSTKGGSYTIKAGDSLSAIAARNGTTVAKLKAANGLKGDMIRAGKTLKIPK